MAAVLVIVGRESAVGFRLGGFECKEVGEQDDMTAVIEAVVAEHKYGFICMEERYFKRVSEGVLRRINRKAVPVIMPIEIPLSWEVGAPEEPHIARLIRRAVGYRIKIRR